VLTQNESVLPPLSGDEDITAPRKKFPHILALEKTTDRAPGGHLDEGCAQQAIDSLKL
jgi:hypothetical protein